MDCKFSLDDFGTGFSSYGYVKTLPVDFLKIDGSFVSKIADDPIDLTMVKSINEVGHVMNRNTIAECVEDERTMSLLHDIGVDYALAFAIDVPRLLEEGEHGSFANCVIINPRRRALFAIQKAAHAIDFGAGTALRPYQYR